MKKYAVLKILLTIPKATASLLLAASIRHWAGNCRVLNLPTPCCSLRFLWAKVFLTVPRTMRMGPIWVPSSQSIYVLHFCPGPWGSWLGVKMEIWYSGARTPLRGRSIPIWSWYWRPANQIYCWVGAAMVLCCCGCNNRMEVDWRFHPSSISAINLPLFSNLMAQVYK